MSKNKFFGRVELEEEVTEKPLEPTLEELSEALSADGEGDLSLAVVDEETETVVLEASVPDTFPFTAVSYYRDNTTGHYHLVSIGYDPTTGTVGELTPDPDRTAMDRNSIEEEFKISVVNNVFNK